MMSSSLYNMLTLSKTKSPQKLFPSDCITLYHRIRKSGLYWKLYVVIVHLCIHYLVFEKNTIPPIIFETFKGVFSKVNASKHISGPMVGIQAILHQIKILLMLKSDLISIFVCIFISLSKLILENYII